MGLEELGTGQQGVQHRSQGIDIGPRVDVGSTCACLFRARVIRCPHKLAELREGAFGRRDRLGETEIDDVRGGNTIDLIYQEVGRLQVAVDDRFLVRVLHTFTYTCEELQALCDAEFFFIAYSVTGSPRT